MMNLFHFLRGRKTKQGPIVQLVHEVSSIGISMSNGLDEASKNVVHQLLDPVEYMAATRRV